jgi:hypothetical protein
MAADHFGGFVFVAAVLVAQTQHTDRDFWWVCREEEREQSRKWWWDPGPLSLARARAELPQKGRKVGKSKENLLLLPNTHLCLRHGVHTSIY